MKSTIWIARDNEQFWINLENKSGWVNMVIEALVEEDAKRRGMEQKYIDKYVNNGGTDETTKETKI